MMPVIEAVCVFPGFAHAGLLCSYCDGGVLQLDSLMMWTEMEMLERGSWPARVEGFIQGQRSDLVIFDDPHPPENLT